MLSSCIAIRVINDPTHFVSNIIVFRVFQRVLFTQLNARIHIFVWKLLANLAKERRNILFLRGFVVAKQSIYGHFKIVCNCREHGNIGISAAFPI